MNTAPVTLLIVDDDKDDREMLEEAIVEMMPHVECLTASNGIEAFQVLSQVDEEPRLIFLDLNMPKMNGFQCLSRLKSDEKYKDIPIIIYTTSNQLADKIQCEKQGAGYFLEKPSSQRSLRFELQKIFSNFFLTVS